MKTAMQELKDVISEMIKNGGTEEDLFAVISHIDNWGIQKEKEQIKESYYKDLYVDLNGNKLFINAEDYYNKAYNI